MKIDVKKHPTIEGLFLTKEGRAFKELKCSMGYGGYITVNMGMNGDKRLRVRRHVLMAETFIGLAPFENAVVRHKNGKAGDDKPSNLKWGTQKQNCQDTVKHGKSTRGVKNSQAKLTHKEAAEILLRGISGESSKILASEFGVSPATIFDLVRRRTWPELDYLLRVPEKKYRIYLANRR